MAQVPVMALEPPPSSFEDEALRRRCAGNHMMTIEAPVADVLLAELNHRWCNWLQTMSVNLWLLSRGENDCANTAGLKALRDQIQAQAALHRRLSMPPESNELERHCRALCLDLLLAFGRTDITPWVSMPDIVLSRRCMQHLGLLIVELMTNAIKHGRPPAENGLIVIGLGPVDNELELVVADNFAPPDVTAPARPRIIAALTDMLGGTLTIDAAPRYVTRIRFPAH